MSYTGNSCLMCNKNVTGKLTCICECGFKVCNICYKRIFEKQNFVCRQCSKFNRRSNAPNRSFLQEHECVSGSESTTSETCDSNHYDFNSQVSYKLDYNDINEPHKIGYLPQLKEVRVVRRNLCYVVGLALEIVQDENKLKDFVYFGKYGKVLNIIVNKNPNFKSPDKKRSCAVYVTYNTSEEARIAIQDIDDKLVSMRRLRASYGTTKYCSNFLKNIRCNNKHCYYLHERGAEKDSFTVDQLNQVKINTRDLTCNALLSGELFSDRSPSSQNFTLFGKDINSIIKLCHEGKVKEDNLTPLVKSKLEELKICIPFAETSTDTHSDNTIKDFKSESNYLNSYSNSCSKLNFENNTIYNELSNISKKVMISDNTINNYISFEKNKSLQVLNNIVHPSLKKMQFGDISPVFSTKVLLESSKSNVLNNEIRLKRAPFHVKGVSRLVSHYFITSADFFARLGSNQNQEINEI